MPSRTGERRTPIGSTRIRQAEAYHVDAALSIGHSAHGTRAQLHDQRHDVPASAHERLQRADADGLGRVRLAGRERGDQERRPAGEVDLRQHRDDEKADAGGQPGDRLVARGHDLQAGILSLEPVAVPEDAGKGHRVQEDRRRQLGPGRPDGARERAGDRWPRLAHRRARRKARDPDVLHGDYALCRRASRQSRPDGRLAWSACARCRRTGSARAKACVAFTRTTSRRRRQADRRAALCTSSRREPTRSWA